MVVSYHISINDTSNMPKQFNSAFFVNYPLYNSLIEKLTKVIRMPDAY